MTGLRAGWTPARIVDILATEGEWMTFAQLDAHFVDRFEAVAEGTVARASYRLMKNHIVECRLGDSYMPSMNREAQLQLEIHLLEGDEE